MSWVSILLLTPSPPMEKQFHEKVKKKKFQPTSTFMGHHGCIKKPQWGKSYHSPAGPSPPSAYQWSSALHFSRDFDESHELCSGSYPVQQTRNCQPQLCLLESRILSAKYSSRPSSVMMGPRVVCSLEGKRSASFSLKRFSREAWKVEKMSEWPGSSNM